MIAKSAVAAMSAHVMIGIYLSAGWLYEQRNASIMTDDAWDALCVRLNEEWDALPDTEHRRKIDREELITATASYLTDDYVPLIVQHSACRRLLEMTGEVVKPREVRLLLNDMTLGEAFAPLLIGGNMEALGEVVSVEFCDGSDGEPPGTYVTIKIADGDETAWGPRKVKITDLDN